jgi:hypothetical protein
MKQALFRVLSIAAGIAITSAAAAQPQVPPSDPNTITVTGNRNAKQEIREFVKALTPVTFDGQMSRFEHSVCPAVFGLAKPQAEAVEERIRAVAKSVDIVVSGPGCAPNVFLLVTSDKKRMIHELWVHASQFFDSGHQATEVERQRGPAAAWGIGGPPVPARGGPEPYVNPNIGPNAYINRTSEASSRITEPARPQFDAAVVVVQKKALVGMTTTQLADYAAIRALTGADPAKLGNSAAPTILHVLDVPVGAEAPITMTKWDFAFLKGYYDARPTLRTGARRSAIADEMDKTIHNPQN